MKKDDGFKVAVAIGILGVAGACTREVAPEADTPPAVTVEVLERSDPSRERRVSASVEPWKTEGVGFQVGGRVEWVVEAGVEVEGDSAAAGDDGAGPGTPIARLDDTKYRTAVRQAEAQVKVLQAQAVALQVEIDKVLPKRLEEGQADLDLASREARRFESLVRQNAAPEVDLERAQAQLKGAEARVAQVKAGKQAKEAELEALRARIQQAEYDLSEARNDLEDCTLRAPFSGRVADVMVIRGGFVQPGQPVVKLVVMDPVKVTAAVSAETDRQIHYGDEVRLYPPQWMEPFFGTVYFKDTIADPQTRTFLVTIMVRNFQVDAALWNRDHLMRLLRDPHLNVPAFNASLAETFGADEWGRRIRHRTTDDAELNQRIVEALLNDRALQARLRRAWDGLASVEDIWPLQRADAGDVATVPRYVHERALYPAEDGWYTWRVTNLAYGDAQKALLALEKVPVQVGDRRVVLPGGLRFRELRDRGGLDGDDFVASGAGADVQGQSPLVTLIRKRWLLRPGELLPVQLAIPGEGAGIYVPGRAVVDRGGQPAVFVVEDHDGKSVVRRRGVRIRGASGERVRIEGPEVATGSRIVVSGAHYLTDGQVVSPVDVDGTNTEL